MYDSKVNTFWEGHKILRNLHQLFVLCTASQIVGGDFAKYMNFNVVGKLSDFSE